MPDVNALKDWHSRYLAEHAQAIGADLRQLQELAAARVELLRGPDVELAFLALAVGVLAGGEGKRMGGLKPDRIFHGELEGFFLSDEEILELTYITAMYEMHATISRALRPSAYGCLARMIDA